ncbi:MAG: sigma-54-dependent Fis family transcriptional regulator [Ignavibacteriaceae bacterium]|nr:sigma-54-dependent Fis family transcriptional regulator [Ignavibacteriaceae bacterium]
MNEIIISDLPRILVIDDRLGREKNSEDREDFCIANGLINITERDVDQISKDIADKYNYIRPMNMEKKKEENQCLRLDEPLYHPVAKVFFHSGQKIRGDKYTNDLEGVKEAISRGWKKRPRWSLILLDIKFNEENFGLTVVEALSEEPEYNNLPIILMSASQREDYDEKKFSYLGVMGFIEKTEIDGYRGILKLLFEYGLLEDNEMVDRLFLTAERIADNKNNNYNYIIGGSTELLRCLREARNRSMINFDKGGDNILVVGETGTGKELIASYIHKMSNRKGILYTVFTEGVSETLIEGELFGWVRGAFTNALYAKEGAAEKADKGTLFVDEFGEIPLTVQSKLLRLLDKNIRETKRLGAEDPIEPTPNIQVVLATNRFEAMASGKKYRSDLLARINAFSPIILPSLKERKEDIPSLAIHFLRKFEKLLSAQKRELTDDALNKLIDHDWKDENIRGLERVLFSAVQKFKILRYLSSNHLEFKNILNVTHGAKTDNNKVELKSSATLIKQIQAFPFDSLNPLEFKGLIPKMEESRALMLGNLIKAAFIFMLSYDRREDTILPITGVAQILFGNSSIKTKAAKDEFLKVFNVSDAVRSKMLEDKLLYILYNICQGNISNMVKDNQSDKAKQMFINKDEFLKQALQQYYLT